MKMIEISQLVVLLGLFLFFLYTSRLLHTRRCVQQALQLHGCKEPVKYPHTGRLRGSDLTALRKQALRDGRLRMLYLEQHRSLGETWQEEVDGNTIVNTISGSNLQYIHLLHASKFHRAVSSSSAAGQLFGKAGFFKDGDEWRWSRKRIEPTFSKYETGTMPMLKTHVYRFIGKLPRDSQPFDAHH